MTKNKVLCMVSIYYTLVIVIYIYFHVVQTTAGSGDEMKGDGVQRE